MLFDARTTSAVGEIGRPAHETDVDFWARQFSEHALFFSLGIEDATLRNQAARLHQAWEAARPTLTAATIVPLALNLREYKIGLFDRLNRGQWLGWIFPTFVDHTRRELDLFLAHLRGPVPVQRDAVEWLRFMAEHAAFAAHLMDPVEAQQIRGALAAVGKLQQLQNACAHGVSQQLVVMSENAGKTLDTFVTNVVPKTKSVIHPVLATHVLREGRRFIYTMKKLQAS